MNQTRVGKKKNEEKQESQVSQKLFYFFDG